MPQFKNSPRILRVRNLLKSGFATILSLAVLFVFAAADLSPIKAQAASSWYVSTSGTPSGDGSINNPWDLATALSHPASVKPGDTIWVRGGNYEYHDYITYSYLTGEPGKPIILRAYPGERATFKGHLVLGRKGDHDVWVWGLEMTNRELGQSKISGINFTTVPAIEVASSAQKTQNIKLINNIIHDNGCVGMSSWGGSENSEFYGNLSFNNGYQGSNRSYCHGLYIQSKVGPQYFNDNILFRNMNQNAQLYGSGDAFLNNTSFEGNVFFSSAELSNQAGGEASIGAWAGVYAQNTTFKNNFIYNPPHRYSWVQFGMLDGASITGNYFMMGENTNGVILNWENRNKSADISGNTILGIALNSSLYPNNTYLNSKPKDGMIFVRPNKYETGRANIIVYNYPKDPTVSVDISSSGIKNGEKFEIRDVNNYYGSPVASGTYNGGKVTIPMTGLTVAAPLVANPNWTVPNTNPKHTAPEFGVFVLLSGESIGRSGQIIPVPPTVITTVPPQSTQTITGTGGSQSTNTTPNNTGTSNQGTVTTIQNTGGSTITSSTIDFSKIGISSNGDTGTYIEAENAVLIAPMTTKSDSSASGGKYISSSVAKQGTVKFNFNAPADGKYYVWIRTKADSFLSDSFYVKSNGGAEDIFDTAENVWSTNWQWVLVNGRGGGTSPLAINPLGFQLSKGTNTIEFTTRDANSIIDRIFITSSAVKPSDSASTSSNSTSNSSTSNSNTNSGTAASNGNTGSSNADTTGGSTGSNTNTNTANDSQNTTNTSSNTSNTNNTGNSSGSSTNTSSNNTGTSNTGSVMNSTTVYLNPGCVESDQTDSKGNKWRKDSYRSGGGCTYTSNAVSGGESLIHNSGIQSLYGVPFSYNIPVSANGSYTIELGFVESSKTSENQRVFDVVANGNTVITNLDIYKEAKGRFILVTRSFDVNVTNGYIKLDFVNRVDGAQLNSIKITSAVGSVLGASTENTENMAAVGEEKSGILNRVFNFLRRIF